MSPRAGIILVLSFPLCISSVNGAPPPDSGQRRDQFGDPLPRGAVSRIGSIRLRHTDAVTEAVFSPDGQWLASQGRWDKFVSVWETGLGKLRARIPVGGAARMAFTPDGKVLAVVLPSGTFTG